MGAKEEGFTDGICDGSLDGVLDGSNEGAAELGSEVGSEVTTGSFPLFKLETTVCGPLILYTELINGPPHL